MTDAPFTETHRIVLEAVAETGANDNPHAVAAINAALAEITGCVAAREALAAQNSWLEAENAIWLNKSHELTREIDQLREVIHLALANKDRTHLGTVRSILADAVNASTEREKLAKYLTITQSGVEALDAAGGRAGVVRPEDAPIRLNERSCKIIQ